MFTAGLLEAKRRYLSTDQVMHPPSLPLGGLLLSLVLLNKDINRSFSPSPQSLIAGVGEDRQMDTQTATWFHFDVR